MDQAGLAHDCDTQHVGACANCRAMVICNVGVALWRAAMDMVLGSYSDGNDDYLSDLELRMGWTMDFCADPANTDEDEKNFRRAMLLTEAMEFHMMRKPGHCPPAMLLETFTILKRLVLERVMSTDRSTF